MLPPAVYLQDIQQPVCKIKSNGDLTDCLIVTRAALKQSNLDKEALRKWLSAADTIP